MSGLNIDEAEDAFAESMEVIQAALVKIEADFNFSIPQSHHADKKLSGISKYEYTQRQCIKSYLNFRVHHDMGKMDASIAVASVMFNKSPFKQTYRASSLLFLPKFHCELNFIEMMWGYIKAQLRRLCTFSFKDLETRLPEHLDNIPLAFVRRASRHCLRYMDGYRAGLVGPELDYAVKKYKGIAWYQEEIIWKL